MRILFTLSLAIFLFGQTSAQDWTEILKIVASDAATDDTYGQAVSISGKYAIVGAYLETEDASGGNTMNQAGSAYILERDVNGDWSEVQKIVASDRTSGDKFGFSVSISGDYAIVGATGEDHDVNGGGQAFDSGSAYVFERAGNGTWSEVQKIVASDRDGQDLFAYSVSMSGNYAVVGAYSEDEDATGGDRKSIAGSAYIFNRDGNGTWGQTQKIVASDREAGDRFGFSVSINNDRIISGAYFEDHDVDGNNTVDEAGSAYIFEKDGDNKWNEVQKISAPDRFEDDNFGRSVSIFGDYAISGAHMEDQDVNEGGNLVDAGAAYIYERNGGGTWNLVQKVVASDRGGDDRFGVSVAISNQVAVIGAWQADNGAGATYMFERDNNGKWNEEQILSASDKNNDDRFGVAVSVSNAYAIVGAHFKANGGAAYMFKSSTISATKDNLFAASLNAYPNPTSSNMTIDLGETYFDVDLTVRNIMGQMILNQKFGAAEQLSFEIEGSAGIYVVEILTKDGKSAALKVIKH